jgi:glycosyltransferase involved in cell wall biosynthesis
MTTAYLSDNGIMVSMVVPVFNVSSYIEEGLESIANQDFKHAYEVILVDDCSTDGSLEICQRYVSNYPDKFTLVKSKTNAGVSSARNLGLGQAQGRYLMFFDPDDVLPPTSISSLFDTAEQYKADIVKGNLILFDDNGRRPAPDDVKRITLIPGEDVLTALYRHNRIRGHIGGKLFKRDVLGNLRFPDGVRMAQDLLYFSEMFSLARSLVLLNQEVYFYRKHQTGSTGRKYERGSYIDWLCAVEDSGKFAVSNEQKCAHKDLLLRTMTQIARECREIPPLLAKKVLQTIEQKCQQWDLRLFRLLTRDRLGLRGISRYIKLQLAIKQIRRNLSDS